MNLVVGCPIKDRAWILPDWAAHLRTALDVAGITSSNVIFVGAREADPDTFAVADTAVGEYEIVPTSEEPGRYERSWTVQRIQHMVQLRNQLLRRVRELEPDLFWSLDSDILVHPEALAGGIEALAGGELAAMGQRCYLADGTVGGEPWCTNAATLTPLGGILREQSDGVIGVQVIMAAKLMTPAAYRVDYAFHHQGEDFGWSLNCNRVGLKLGWDGRFTSKHIRERPRLLKEPVE